MKMIKCPDCGKMISSQAIQCPSCGRPIASPSKERTKGIYEAKRKLLNAVENVNGFEALKQLGVLEYLKSDHINYYSGIAYFASEQYEKALQYLNCVQSDDKYYEDAFNKTVIIFANQGNTLAIIDKYRSNPQIKIHRVRGAYYIILSLQNATNDDFRKCIKELECCAFYDHNDVHFIDNDNSLIDAQFGCLICRKFAQALTDAFKQLSNYVFLTKIDSKNKRQLMNNTVYFRAVYILKLFNIAVGSKFINYLVNDIPDEQLQFLKTSDYQHPYDINELLCLSKTDEELSRIIYDINWKKCYSEIIGKLSSIDYPGMDDISPTLCIIHNYYEIDDWKYLVVTRNNIDKLEDAFFAGNIEAGNVISILYAHEIIANVTDLELKKFIENSGNVLIPLVENEIISASLTPKGRVRYDAAEKHYMDTKKRDFGWDDAGSLSIDYFGIIELELNEKLIRKICAYVDMNKINKLYESKYEQISSKSEKKRYDRKWTEPIKTMLNIKNNADANGMSLGGLYQLLINLNDKDDQISIELWPFIEQLLTVEGIASIRNKKFADIINYDQREKYRNPPAHTKMLPYEIAEQCREYVRKNIIAISSWIKKSESDYQLEHYVFHQKE